MKSKTYVRVGILFLASLVIVFWGLNYLKGKNILSTERSFFALYHKIGGLTKTCPVTINGFQIGQVRQIRLSEKDQGVIEVKFSVSYQSIKIPKGSTARIYSVDLMGTKGIALDLSTDPVLCKSNDTLKSAVEGDLRDEVNAQMLPLKLKAESLMSSMDSLLMSIHLVFSERNRKNLAESFTSVNATLNNLESSSQFLNEYVREESRKITIFLTRIDTLSQGFIDKTGEFQNFITNLNTFSNTLNAVPLVATFDSFREVLDHIHTLTERISLGEGSLGKIMVSDSLYSAVLATNSSLNRLIEDVRIHPGKYVSLSLSNKSRSVYAVNDSDLAKALGSEGSSDFYICLLQSPTPLAPGDPSLKGGSPDSFIQVGSLYYYYVYENQRIEPCLKKLEKVRKQNPSAGIFTWVEGKWKRLSM